MQGGEGDDASTPPGSSSVAGRIWSSLTDPNDQDGPVEIGPLEYETLRIEGGSPGFGFEMTGDRTEGGGSLKASPMELDMGRTVDNENKGCYLGQEGVAAILKNARGPPRRLYSVSFRDDENDFGDDDDYENGGGGGSISGEGLMEALFGSGYRPREDEAEEGEKGEDAESWEEYDDDGMIDVEEMLRAAAAGRDGSAIDLDVQEGEDRDDDDDDEDPTSRLPSPGDELFALGSDGKVKVGTLTSVAERGGTGEPLTLALALVRRSDAIVTKMEELGLEIGGGGRGGGAGGGSRGFAIEDPGPIWRDDGVGGGNIPTGGGMILPPPLFGSDPLEGLEVVIGRGGADCGEDNVSTLSTPSAGP